jgi:hypothetical protein
MQSQARPKTVLRAFQIAKSSSVKSLPDLRRDLAREGYRTRDIESQAILERLRAHIAETSRAL